ncbi:oxidoreductase [Vibrio sp. MACH09]|uniref:SDR family NAD(P)-dependent oxidoreductase n=1 Tax=Vibrio sp. MACH09 TaxID=3025122 RepID=UPI00278E7D2D|nr:SDR family NAD(P)-dependent oxidoreductase [Vibrio sp. MACH09]GLO62599.1 oxidoreductase [Vibrio sp. MACH09]
MQKTILITGATDGIGYETTKMLASQGHHLLIHGRSMSKLSAVKEELESLSDVGQVSAYLCDLSILADVEAFARKLLEQQTKLDVLINNAGIYNVDHVSTEEGLDVRFAVNTFAPYLLTKRLLDLFQPDGRIINLSSAAQSTVSLEELVSEGSTLPDNIIYAQSKLAITMWSRALAATIGASGPSVIAVNPASLLGSKMVKQAYGVAGGDLQIGADVLCRAALSEQFSNATGLYFDNDIGQFSSPHPDALDKQKTQQLVDVIESVLAKKVR